MEWCKEFLECLFGSYLAQGTEPERIPFADLFAGLKKLFENDVEEGSHWVSVFYATLNGEVSGIEITLDNKPWLAASALASQWGWSVAQGYASVRHFFLAMSPNQSIEPTPGKRVWRFAAKLLTGAAHRQRWASRDITRRVQHEG